MKNKTIFWILLPVCFISHPNTVSFQISKMKTRMSRHLLLDNHFSSSPCVPFKTVINNQWLSTKKNYYISIHIGQTAEGLLPRWKIYSIIPRPFPLIEKHLSTAASGVRCVHTVIFIPWLPNDSPAHKGGYLWNRGGRKGGPSTSRYRVLQHLCVCLQIKVIKMHLFSLSTFVATPSLGLLVLYYAVWSVEERTNIRFRWEWLVDWNSSIYFGRQDWFQLQWAYLDHYWGNQSVLQNERTQIR